MNKQIIGIVTYLLNYHTEKKKSQIQELLLELSNDGDVQIDAIGSWIENFSIQQFQIECKDIKQSLKIFHGSIQSNYVKLYYLKFDRYSNRYQIQLHGENEPIIEDCSNYLRFKFAVSKGSVRSAFSRLNPFFKTMASKYPDVKMTFSGNVKFLKEKEATDKYIKMISESVEEIMTHNTTLQFRDAIDKLNISNKQEAIQIVHKTLTNISAERQ